VAAARGTRANGPVLCPPHPTPPRYGSPGTQSKARTGPYACLILLLILLSRPSLPRLSGYFGYFSSN